MRGCVSRCELHRGALCRQLRWRSGGSADLSAACPIRPGETSSRVGAACCSVNRAGWSAHQPESAARNRPATLASATPRCSCGWLVRLGSRVAAELRARIGEGCSVADAGLRQIGCGRLTEGFPRSDGDGGDQYRDDRVFHRRGGAVIGRGGRTERSRSSSRLGHAGSFRTWPPRRDATAEGAFSMVGSSTPSVARKDHDSSPTPLFAARPTQPRWPHGRGSRVRSRPRGFMPRRGSVPRW